MCPREGVNRGRAEAVEKSLVREVTVESWRMLGLLSVGGLSEGHVPSYFPEHCQQRAPCRCSPR